LPEVSGWHRSVPVQPSLVTGLQVVSEALPWLSTPASSSPPPSYVKLTQLPFEGGGEGTVHTAGTPPPAPDPPAADPPAPPPLPPEPLDELAAVDELDALAALEELDAPAPPLELLGPQPTAAMIPVRHEAARKMATLRMG
jgi:hypothetical protein